LLIGLLFTEQVANTPFETLLGIRETDDF